MLDNEQIIIPEILPMIPLHSPRIDNTSLDSIDATP